MTELQQKLFSFSDEKYKHFNVKLIPNLDAKKIIGVRTPKLRMFAKEFFHTRDCRAFLEALPHEYFEENQIHGFLLEQIKDFDECIVALNRFLPFVNNWATCDQCTPKVFKKNTERLLPIIVEWLNREPSEKSEYVIRFGIRMIMCFYLDEHFKLKHLRTVVSVKSDLYYINMMIAWFFATALAKQWETTLPFISDKSILSEWVRKKTIQKACESFRVTTEHKSILKSLLV